MKRFAKRFGSAFVLVLGIVAIDVSAQDVRSWLDRMNRAVEDLNYEGTFVHVHAGRAETLHIVHRNSDGLVGEKISSMDGVGREIVRRGQNVQCVLPDRRVVLQEQPRQTSPLVSTLPNYSEALEEHYQFRSHQKGQVALRDTQVIGITPKDEFRYGYIVWLDLETAMPLRTQVRDENGEVLEQILFTNFATFDSIPESALESTVDTEGFTWIRPPKSVPRSGAEVSWRAALLPSGFELTAAKQSLIAGSDYPVEHLVYSDGLATVSIFIEDPNAKADVTKGFSQFGSINAYSLTVGGRKVTVMGEVPRQTVQRIATSLDAK